MITLSTERGLVKVKDWDDILSLPGFIENLDPKDQKLDSIIGQYIFADKIRCGLSNCHTPHAKGYVASTESGQITNIGKDCGKRYFGIDFENLSKKFDSDVKAQNNRELLSTFKNQLEKVTEDIKFLRNAPKGADWVNRKARQLTSFGGEVPSEAVRKLIEMAKIKSGSLSINREATAEEIEDLEAISGKEIKIRPHYISEKIANIIGIEALYPENDLRQILVIDLESGIKQIDKLDIYTATHTQLAHHAKWASQYEEKIESARRSVQYGKALLAKENLAPLKHIIKSPADINSFENYLKSL
ncbi:hypothetical protein N7365_12810 [Pseudomonas sediminis]|uniref:hypothetical protein n=1 Tax=Pseudomonas sediminis TaxID=1691904 RepID=UPI002448D5E7|nr:hypothetical protein [Pseudomonas sediminis]MDG9758973.1 hypothetical protein [Pseudomonas sediminis]